MTTKQSIHTEARGTLMSLVGDNVGKECICDGCEENRKFVESFYDQQIQKLLEEIVPKEITSAGATKISAQVLTDANGKVKFGFNQAIQEIKERIKQIGY